MAQAPRDLAPLESARQFFGAELRHWRNLRGLSQKRLAQLTHHSEPMVAKVEKAERLPSLDFARRMDTFLVTGGALERIWPRLQPATAPEAGVLAAADTIDHSLGLEWSSTPASAVGTVAELWKADMDRRQLILNAPWAAAALSPSVRRWLYDATDPDTSHTGGRRIGRSEVDVMRSMCHAFADADHQLGGGYARSTLIQFMDTVVSPMLKGTYDAETGQQLFAAAARLSDLGGFMCFDSARQGLGQRYFIQALRMAKASGDRALGAHILADMAMQAHHLGRPAEALALADAGHRTAKDCGSPSTAARCSVLTARAHAIAGDANQSARAMGAAETELNRAQPAEEPFWIRFFTEEQLAAEAMYVAHDLGRADEVQRNAPVVLQSSAGMQRREVLAATTLAASYLSTKRRPDHVHVDVDMACKVLSDALPAAKGLTSARGLASINAVRTQLVPFWDRPAVRQVEAEFHEVVAATA